VNACLKTCSCNSHTTVSLLAHLGDCLLRGGSFDCGLVGGWLIAKAVVPGGVRALIPPRTPKDGADGQGARPRGEPRRLPSCDVIGRDG